jgi:hypothetical protein
MESIFKISDLEKEAKRIDQERNTLNKQIEELTKKRDAANYAHLGVINIINYMKGDVNGYRNNQDSNSQATEVLNSEDSFIGTVENIVLNKLIFFTSAPKIAEFLGSLDKTEEEKDKLERKVSSALSIIKRKKKTIANFSPTKQKRDTLWGKNEWFDEKGKPKQAHIKEKAPVLAEA